MTLEDTFGAVGAILMVFAIIFIIIGAVFGLPWLIGHVIWFVAKSFGWVQTEWGLWLKVGVGWLFGMLSGGSVISIKIDK